MTILETHEYETTATGGKITKGDVQCLFGKTINGANVLLAEKLTKGSTYWMNYNFGANVGSNGRINYLYIYKGSKFTLFGVYPGMAWSTALTTVKSSDMKWQQYYKDSTGIWYSSTKYPSRVLCIEKSGSKVKEVYYGVNSYFE